MRGVAVSEQSSPSIRKPIKCTPASCLDGVTLISAQQNVLAGLGE